MPASSQSDQSPSSTPLISKILIAINVALFVLELILYPAMNIDLVQTYCLSPANVLDEIETNTLSMNGMASLFLSNLFHLNPMTGDPIMGIMHISMNMMVLHSLGKYLEFKFGSFPFLCITALLLLIVGPLQIPIAMILEYITMNSVALLSTNQCGVGFSAVLFAYFMLYLYLVPTQNMVFCGITMKKWIIPFLQLLMLSVLLHASFIGHLSGILVGLLYCSGVPGCFRWRQRCLLNVEQACCTPYISKRADYCSSPSLPNIGNLCAKKKCARSRGSVIRDNVSDTSDETNIEHDEEMDGLIAL